MKVLLIANQIDTLGGGAAAAVRQLAEGLGRRGVRVVVVCSQREPQPARQVDGALIYSFRPRNLYWIGDKDSQPAYRKVAFQVIDFWNPHVYQVVREIIAREQPDVVHVHKLRGLSPSLWRATRQAGVARLVHTCHDYELLSPEGTLSGGLGQRAAVGSPWLRPYQGPRRAWSRAVVAVTAPSRFTLDQHTRLGFFAGAKQFVVPNSHGLSRAELEANRAAIIAPAKTDDNTRPTRLLYLGRLDPPKGVDLLCAAFEQAVAAEPSLCLDIAGWGTMLEMLRARFGHIPQLTFHGPVDGQVKRDLVAAADALVVPSVWGEVFGIVIAEAYAYGKPVIATNIGAIPELIQEGQTGFLLPPGDVAALTIALQRAAARPAQLRSMASACLSAANSYTLESMVDAYMAVYATA